MHAHSHNHLDGREANRPLQAVGQIAEITENLRLELDAVQARSVGGVHHGAHPIVVEVETNPKRRPGRPGIGARPQEHVPGAGAAPKLAGRAGLVADLPIPETLETAGEIDRRHRHPGLDSATGGIDDRRLGQTAQVDAVCGPPRPRRHDHDEDDHGEAGGDEATAHHLPFSEKCM